MTEKPLSQGPVESFHNALVTVGVHVTPPDRNSLFNQQLIHSTYELSTGVHLQMPGPGERAAFVDMTYATSAALFSVRGSASL